MEPTTTDAELLRRVLRGEQDAFGVLVERHHAHVLGLCVSMLGDAAAAEDAAQDAFLKAYRSLAKFNGESAFGTWIYRIASNHCTDVLRSRSRKATESLDAIVETGGDAQRGLHGGGREERDVENSDLAGRLLGELPEQYRMALIMREVEGMSCAELAERFECSVTAVKARLRRARISLDAAASRYFEPRSVV